MWPVLFLHLPHLSRMYVARHFHFPCLAKLKLLLPTCFFIFRADHIYRAMKRENIKKIKISKILESKIAYIAIFEMPWCSIVEYMGFCFSYEMAHSRKFSIVCISNETRDEREKKCFCILYILLLLLAKAASAQRTIGKCLGREKNSFIDLCYHNRK